MAGHRENHQSPPSAITSSISSWAVQSRCTTTPQLPPRRGSQGTKTSPCPHRGWTPPSRDEKRRPEAPPYEEQKDAAPGRVGYKHCGQRARNNFEFGGRGVPRELQRFGVLVRGFGGVSRGSFVICEQYLLGAWGLSCGCWIRCC